MNEQTRISGLEAILKSQSDAGELPPVDSWNPPYCGDIGMSILADGTWMYQGSPIGRNALVKLFARVLRRDEDGNHYLVTPAEKILVTVEDAPFLAVEMQIEAAGTDQQSLTFRTNVDDIVTCGKTHPLRFEEERGTGGLKPYLKVRGRLDALVTRALYYDLVELAQPIPDATDDSLGVISNGVLFALQPGPNRSSP